MRASLPALLLTACASVQATHEAELPAGEVRRVFGDVERGAVAYFGVEEPEVVEVAVRTWARAGSPGGAQARMATTRWGVEIVGDLLDLWARAPEPKSGVDVAVAGPADVSVDLLTVEGTAEAHGVTGSAVLTGSAVFGTALRGDVDAVGLAGSVELEAFPPDDATLAIEAVDGDVVLALPYGAPLALDVQLDEGWGYQITDLGFDDVDDRPHEFRASTGEATLRVDVRVTNGGFFLYEAVEPTLPTPTGATE